MKIGVFDSGIGGEAVAQQLQRLLPDATIITANDHAHVPYGGRTTDEIQSLTERALQPLLTARCDAIVIACNTATTAAIRYLRAMYPMQRFVGLEPMVKPAAALTKTKTIAVLATPATLQSERYAELKRTWATGITIVEPDCRDWAATIENGSADDIPLERLIAQLKAQSVDVIVLACTHYHWLKARIEAAAGSYVTVLEPSDAISARISSIVNS